MKIPFGSALSLALLFITPNVQADFYSDNPQGWLNYNYSAPVATPKTKPLTPSQKLSVFQAHLNDVKAESVMNPTETNVLAYIDLQSHVQNKAVQYQQMWQKVLLDYPQYDSELTHPTDSIANQVQHQATEQQEIAAVKAFAEHYGLVFFYNSEDPYAKAMAPSLQGFADQYGIALLGISMDSTILSAIGNNQVNKGQASHLGVQHLPALFLVNPQTGSAVPVAYGFLAQDQLLQRFYDLETGFSGQDLMVNTGVKS